MWPPATNKGRNIAKRARSRSLGQLCLCAALLPGWVGVSSAQSSAGVAALACDATPMRTHRMTRVQHLRHQVTLVLLHPGSARFRDQPLRMIEVKECRSPVLCGWVNARGGNGRYAGFAPFIATSGWVLTGRNDPYNSLGRWWPHLCSPQMSRRAASAMDFGARPSVHYSGRA